MVYGDFGAGYYLPPEDVEEDLPEDDPAEPWVDYYFERKADG
jgi:hypothetical protein